MTGSLLLISFGVDSPFCTAFRERGRSCLPAVWVAAQLANKALELSNVVGGRAGCPHRASSSRRPRAFGTNPNDVYAQTRGNGLDHTYKNDSRDSGLDGVFYVQELDAVLNTMTPTKENADRASGDHPVGDITTYPPFKIVLPAMVAVWLVFFVVALVYAAPMVTIT
jgi:hypothetical protein